MFRPIFVLFLLAVPLVYASDLQEELHQAIYGRSDDDPEDVEKVKELLAKGADLNGKHPDSGQTPVMAATLGGRLEILKYLMSQGADPSIGEMMGYTPMHGVGFQGRWEVGEYLITEHNLDPNDFHEDGFAPLHRACWGETERHTETVKMLLRHGVDPQLKTKEGKSPLEITPNEGTKKVLRMAARSKKKPKTEL
eukprot:CAMPEP_0175138470 /NCGR_PEP_ID=MMETSP0087-20121206/10369_1 /TAXON_ID=136419 /ORGANISM="Unknown Unknown, Strain D1" /LENGTH=194 /DNA_ID=CAMNT_0016421381 /DNA_START=18 /DNA_END=602 /DNA_ORIENTATION=+